MNIKKIKIENFILTAVIFASFLYFTETSSAQVIEITNLDAGSCNSQSIDITWDDVVGEDGYIVYRNGTSTGDIIATLPAASSGSYSYTDNFSDDEIFVAGTSYDYFVGYYIGATTTTSASSSVTSAYNCAECGSAENNPTDTEPTTDLCGSGNSLEDLVDLNADSTLWVWSCRNDDAHNDGITIENSCDVENTNWVYIKEFNLNPRIVSTTTDECTINYTIETSSSTATNCQLNDTSGATSTLIFVDDVAASTSAGIIPGESYKILCEFDDGVTSVEKETEYRSCNLNPSFDIF